MKEYMNDIGVGDDSAPRTPARSFLAMQSLQFGGGRVRNGGQRKVGKGKERGRRASFGNSTTQYHSLADSMGGGRSQFPRKRASSVEVPVLPMSILKSTPHSTSPSVTC